VAHDVVVLYRVCATAEGRRFARAARACGAALVYSTDDLVFDADQAPPQMGKRFRALAPLHIEMLSEADAALASTEYLAERMRVAVPETPVYTLRNFLDEEIVLLSEAARRRNDRTESGRVTLAYLSGSPTHDEDLATVAEPLRQVLEASPQAELLLVGPVRMPISLVERETAGQVRRMDAVGWRSLPALIAEQGVSINLAPLDLTRSFCHAKSEVKFLEAAALGIPTAASASKGFQEAIPNADGNEGCILLSGPDDWEQCLSFLVQNMPERLNYGSCACGHVHSVGTMAANAARVNSVFAAFRRLSSTESPRGGSERTVNWPFSARYALKSALERGISLRNSYRLHRQKGN
jgi:glycosyltransferase involved in cell wall biosynthesis